MKIVTTKSIKETFGQLHVEIDYRDDVPRTVYVLGRLPNTGSLLVTKDSVKDLLALAEFVSDILNIKENK